MRQRIYPLGPLKSQLAGTDIDPAGAQRFGKHWGRAQPKGCFPKVWCGRAWRSGWLRQASRPVSSARTRAAISKVIKDQAVDQLGGNSSILVRQRREHEKAAADGSVPDPRRPSPAGTRSEAGGATALQPCLRGRDGAVARRTSLRPGRRGTDGSRSRMSQRYRGTQGARHRPRTLGQGCALIPEFQFGRATDPSQPHLGHSPRRVPGYAPPATRARACARRGPLHGTREWIARSR
jgi:hypothetical protein